MDLNLMFKSSHNFESQIEWVEAIRLVHIFKGIFGKWYVPNTNLEEVTWNGNYYKIPENMSLNEAYTIISFLCEYIEQFYEFEHCSKISIYYVNNILEEYHFTRVQVTNTTNIINLYTIQTSGILLSIKEPQDYFEWFIPNVSYDEVKSIYDKLNLDIPSIKEEKKEKMPIIKRLKNKIRK